MIESILNFLHHYVATELEVADVEEKRRKIKKNIPDFLKKEKTSLFGKEGLVSTDSAPYLNYIYLINLIFPPSTPWGWNHCDWVVGHYQIIYYIL